MLYNAPHTVPADIPNADFHSRVLTLGTPSSGNRKGKREGKREGGRFCNECAGTKSRNGRAALLWPMARAIAIAIRNAERTLGACALRCDGWPRDVLERKDDDALFLADAAGAHRLL